jgi:OCT family organic cation transporter-like MFS transporter 4/5
MTLSGVFSALFLPETLHQKLPNTIQEAESFGKHQSFWHVPKKPEPVPDEEMVKLRLNNHA